MEFVTVRHPDVEQDAVVSRAAFDVVYQEKGWQLVPGADEVTEPSAPQGDVPPAPPTEAPVEAEEPAPSDTPIGDAITAATPAPEV